MFNVELNICVSRQGLINRLKRGGAPGLAIVKCVACVAW